MKRVQKNKSDDFIERVEALCNYPMQITLSRTKKQPRFSNLQLIHPQLTKEEYFLSKYIEDNYLVDELRKKVLRYEIPLSDEMVILFVLASFSTTSPQGTINKIYNDICYRLNPIMDHVYNEFDLSIHSGSISNCFVNYFFVNCFVKNKREIENKLSKDIMIRNLHDLKIKYRIYEIFIEENNYNLFEIVFNRIIADPNYYMNPIESY